MSAIGSTTDPKVTILPNGEPAITITPIIADAPSSSDSDHSGQNSPLSALKPIILPSSFNAEQSRMDMSNTCGLIIEILLTQIILKNFNRPALPHDTKDPQIECLRLLQEELNGLSTEQPGFAQSIRQHAIGFIRKGWLHDDGSLKTKSELEEIFPAPEQRTEGAHVSSRRTPSLIQKMEPPPTAADMVSNIRQETTDFQRQKFEETIRFRHVVARVILVVSVILGFALHPAFFALSWLSLEYGNAAMYAEKNTEFTRHSLFGLTSPLFHIVNSTRLRQHFTFTPDATTQDTTAEDTDKNQLRLSNEQALESARTQIYVPAPNAEEYEIAECFVFEGEESEGAENTFAELERLVTEYTHQNKQVCLSKITTVSNTDDLHNEIATINRSERPTPSRRSPPQTHITIWVKKTSTPLVQNPEESVPESVPTVILPGSTTETGAPS